MLLQRINRAPAQAIGCPWDQTGQVAHFGLSIENLTNLGSGTVLGTLNFRLPALLKLHPRSGPQAQSDSGRGLANELLRTVLGL